MKGTLLTPVGGERNNIVRGGSGSRSGRLVAAFVLISAFLIPALASLSFFSSYGMAPFGEKSVLIMDMSGQYVEFLSGLKHIHSPADIFFNWGRVLGSNYTGVFAYYASSPLNFLTLFFPDRYMPQGLLFLTVLKIGLCGRSMAVFLGRVLKRLRKRTGVAHNGYSGAAFTVIFSALYALCSYNCVYSMCVMWLDGVMILPLLLYFTEELVDSGRVAGLTACLVYVFISNYYIAFMCGVFTALYFVFYCFDREKSEAEPLLGKGTRAYFYVNRAAKFLFCALLAAALSAWLLLPAYFSLTEGKIGSGNSSYPSDWNYGFSAFIRKLFVGEYDSITNSGAPFFFCGTAVMIACPAFFFSRREKKGSRAAALVLLLFLLFSTVWSPLDNMWHIFQHPNWFPYRWSFVLCCFGVLLAFRGALSISSRAVSPSYFPGFLLCFGALSAAAVKMKEDAPDAGNARYQVLTACCLSLVFLGFMLLGRGLPPRKTGVNAAKTAICVALALAMTVISWREESYHWKRLLGGLDRAHDYETSLAYSEYREEMNRVLAAAEEDRRADGSTGFAGIGQTFSRSYNEAVGSGYRSVAHYSSAFNRRINGFLGYLGYSQSYLWNLDFGATAVTDSLFGLRYMISGSGIGSWDKEYKIETGSTVPPYEYDAIGVFDGAFGMTLYRNPFAAAGPFIMAKDPDGFSWGRNCFDSQNSLIRICSGLAEDVFYAVPEAGISVSVSGAREEPGGNGVYRGNGGVLRYTVEADRDGVLYAYFGQNRNSETAFRVISPDGSVSEDLKLYRGETNCIQRLSLLKKGEKAVVSIDIGRNGLYTEDNIFYVLDTGKLAGHMEKIGSETLRIDSFGSGRLSGTFESGQAGGAMFVQVPYDRGWTVKADGRKVNIRAMKDGFLIADIPEGTRRVEMIYRAPGAIPGAVLSGAALVFTVISCVAGTVRKKKRKSSGFRIDVNWLS